jgi:heat shock protein HslJ
MLRIVKTLPPLLASAILFGCAPSQHDAKPSAGKIGKMIVKRPRLGDDIALSAPPYEGSSAPRANAPFTGIAWHWLGNLAPRETDKVEHPDNYTLELRPNGWFGFKADCKSGSGMYEINGERIALAVINVAPPKPCRNDPHAENFVKSLETAGHFRLSGDKLYFDMKREAKTMVFWKTP